MAHRSASHPSLQSSSSSSTGTRRTGSTQGRQSPRSLYVAPESPPAKPPKPLLPRLQIDAKPALKRRLNQGPSSPDSPSLIHSPLERLFSPISPLRSSAATATTPSLSPVDTHHSWTPHFPATALHSVMDAVRRKSRAKQSSRITSRPSRRAADPPPPLPTSAVSGRDMEPLPLQDAAAVKERKRRHRHTLSHGLPIPPLTPADETEETSLLSSGNHDRIVAIGSPLNGKKSPTVPAHARHEIAWDGEWNNQNMHDVISRLRTLR